MKQFRLLLREFVYVIRSAGFAVEFFLRIDIA